MSFSKFADSKFRPKEMGIAGGLGLLGGAAMNDVTRRGRSAMKNMPRADRWKARGVSGAALGIGAAGLTDWSLSMKDSVNKHKERKERKQNKMTPEERRAYQEEVDRQSQFPYQRDKEDEVLDEFQRQAIEKGRYDGPKFDNLTPYNVEQFPYELNDETAQLVQKYPRIVEAMKKDNRRDFGGVMLDFNLEKDNPERLDKLYRVTTKLMDEGLYGGYKRQMSDEEMDDILHEDFIKNASFSKFANEQRIDQYVRQAGAEEGKVKGMLGGGLLGAGTGALGGGTAATYLNRIKRGPNTPRNVAGGALATLAGVGGAYLGGKKGGEVGELAGAEQKMRQYDGMLREAGVNPQLLHRYVGVSKQDAVNEGKRFGTLAEQNQWMNKDEREKKASYLDQRMLKLANADQLDDVEVEEQKKSKIPKVLGGLGALAGGVIGHDVGAEMMGKREVERTTRPMINQKIDEIQGKFSRNRDFIQNDYVPQALERQKSTHKRLAEDLRSMRQHAKGHRNVPKQVAAMYGDAPTSRFRNSDLIKQVNAMIEYPKGNLSETELARMRQVDETNLYVGQAMRDRASRRGQPLTTLKDMNIDKEKDFLGDSSRKNAESYDAIANRQRNTIRTNKGHIKHMLNNKDDIVREGLANNYKSRNEQLRNIKKSDDIVNASKLARESGRFKGRVRGATGGALLGAGLLGGGAYAFANREASHLDQRMIKLANEEDKKDYVTPAAATTGGIAGGIAGAKAGATLGANRAYNMSHFENTNPGMMRARKPGFIDSFRRLPDPTEVRMPNAVEPDYMFSEEQIRKMHQNAKNSSRETGRIVGRRAGAAGGALLGAGLLGGAAYGVNQLRNNEETEEA